MYPDPVYKGEPHMRTTRLTNSSPWRHERGLLSRLRPLGAGLISLLVVGGAVLYVLAPTSEALAMSVSSRASHLAGHEVIYGEVTDYTHHVVHNADVLIYSLVHGRHILVRELRAGPNGTYRTVLEKPRGIYVVELVVRANGRTLTRLRTMRLVPGRDYRVSGRVTVHDLFAFLPVSSY